MGTTGDRVIRLNLPHPPSINHYWRRRGNLYFVSPEGQAFHRAVHAEVLAQLGLQPIFLKGRIDFRMRVHHPDRRTRDIDNLIKPVADSLTQAKIWLDDKQIDRLFIERGESVKGGRIYVEIREI